MSRIETIGDHTLYLGDCREILPTLGKIDAVVTDPPYGQNYRAPEPRTSVAAARGLNGRWRRSGARPSPAFVRGDDERPDVGMICSLAPQIIIWGAHKFSDLLPAGQWLLWDKRVDMPAIDQGDGEAAWFNRDGPIRIIRHRWAGLILEPGSEEAKRKPGTSEAQARLHPTQKPIRVMEWCIEQLDDCETILDPFMGSGTTGVACARLGRKFIGIEIEPKYFDIACRRIEAAHKEPRLFGHVQGKPKPIALF